MIGGTVCEIIDLPEKGMVWINVRDRRDECAIYVKRDARALSVAEGDSLWWQSGWGLWTPAGMPKAAPKKSGVDYDIRLERIGFSGVSRPLLNAAAQPPKGDAL